jgi:predicted nucleic acid-binding protein
MTSATLTFPPSVTARLVVDTDVTSFIFKWHPQFAPRYVAILRGYELAVLETFLADFKVLHSDNVLCSTWAAVRNVSTRRGRPIGEADAWIAATAMVLSVPLVTNNPKDYRHLDKLQRISVAAG